MFSTGILGNTDIRNEKYIAEWISSFGEYLESENVA